MEFEQLKSNKLSALRKIDLNVKQAPWINFVKTKPINSV